MSSHDFVVVILIAAAFCAFGTTLAATIWFSGRETERGK